MAKRELGEINAGSMADIAFLLLIFFLVTTTMDVDTGIARVLPPIPQKTDIIKMDINKRNVFVVKINAYDNLLVNGRPMDISELKEKAIEFIRSDAKNDKLPEMTEVSIDFDGKKQTVLVGEGVISLQNDRGTTYGKYIAVQDLLVAAYNELRNEASLQYFGVSKYDELTESQQASVREVYPQRISEAEPKNIGGK